MKPWTLLDKLVWKIARWATGFIMRPLIFIGITPNQLTILSSVINFSLAALCFTQGTYGWSLIGLFFLLVHAYFDFADGGLARATGQTSELGIWLDPRLDVLGAEAVMVGITVGIIRQNPGSLWLAIVALALFSRMGLLALVFDYKRAIYGSPKFLEKFDRASKLTVMDKVVKEFITLRSFPFLFLGTLRYLLTLMVVLNQLKWFLLITAVFNNLRWLIMFWAYVMAHGDQKTNLRVIKILRQFILPKGS